MLQWIKFETCINLILPFILFLFIYRILDSIQSLKSSGNILLILQSSGKRNDYESFVNGVDCGAIIIHKRYKRIREGFVSKLLSIRGNSCKIKKEFSRNSDV